ncbi:MAG: hypothetical protein LBF95_04380 [Treponema sp.]|nr:hypothetical protein [Treponema sp.]
MAVLPQGLNPARLPASDPVPAGGLGSGLDWDLLWAGTWKSGGNLTNRADLGFHLSGPGLTLRAEVLDRRPGDSETLFHRFPWEVEDALTQVLAGLYHDSTGSRILYGPLEEWGLAARLRNPWSRSLPFAESHRASLVDLRTVPSAKAPELYLYLGSPFVTLPGQGGRGPELRVSAALRLDPTRLGAEPGDSGALFPLGEGTALNTSLELRPGKTTALSLEGFYTAASLPARESSGWFSQPPPLPPQRFSLYGAGLLVTTTYLSLSADLARSRTSIMGGDLYASLGLRAGNRGSGGLSRPGGDWQLSLAVDGAGRNYTGSDGASPGAGFRTGGKFEWRHSRAGLFRINSTVSGPGLTWGGALRFNRSSSGLSYRPPATALPLRLSRISLGADRDAGDGGTVKDSAAVSLGVTANPRGIGLTGALALNFSGSLTGSPAGDWAGGDREPSPWPVPGGPYRFESFKIAGDLSWLRPLSSGAKGTGRRSLRLKAGLDYTVKAPAPEEDFTKSRNFEIQAVLSGDRDRIGVTLSSSAFPWEIPSPAWELGLSWKVER